MRIFSGIQPTGRKHLGNYIGAITQWVAGQDRGEAIYCLVDLHAITVSYEPAVLRESVYDTAATLLAAGLDPERCIFFRQSTVYVLDDPDAIVKKFRSSVTDSGREVVRAPDKPGISNLIEILAAVRGEAPDRVEAEFDGAGYGAFKTAVAEAVVDYLAPIRERYRRLRDDEQALEGILAEGAAKAREIAAETLADVRRAMGVGPVRRSG